MRQRPSLVRNPFVDYFRSRLHRRLFGSFGAAIFITGATVAIVMSLFGGGVSPRTELARVRAFMTDRFAAAWDDPKARDDLLRSMAEELDVDLVASDASGKPLETRGAPCPNPSITIDVVRRGEKLGTVGVCTERHRAPPLRMPLALLAAGAMLWAISGKVARHITRPIAELARVAEDIGRGKLSSRAPVGCHQPGEVGVLFKAINLMASRIEKQLADQRELLAAVSHEIRTPLARIRLLVEIARDNGATEATFDELDREVIEIDRLVGELLASSRLDFAALTPARLEARETAARALDRAGVEASRLDADGVTTCFQGDATLIARALANLIENARTHGDGVASLRVRADTSSVRFEVDDRGHGFEPGDETKAFASFYRRAPSNGKDKGSLGLGLALVKRIAEAHGGRAFAQNRPEGGARVGIEIPLAGATTPPSVAPS